MSSTLSSKQVLGAVVVVLAGQIFWFSNPATRIPRAPVTNGTALNNNGTTPTFSMIPQQPAAYPNPDETVQITGTYLQDPIVVNALAYVTSVVPASVLAIPPSGLASDQYTVTYKGDATANCYWPSNLCVRNTTGNWGLADISTCTVPNSWGVTYDDGPFDNLDSNGNHVNDTTTLVASLKAINVTATNFVTGSQVTYSANSTLQLLIQNGHHIGAHTWSHHPLTALTNEQIVAEMMYTQALVYNNTGLVLKYFRPPYGDIDDRVRAIVHALGFRVVIWDNDSMDADVVANAADFGPVLATIQSWFNKSTPRLTLEHNIDTFTTGIAMTALNQIRVQGITNKMMSVPECLSDKQWYQNSLVPTDTPTNATQACTGAGCPGDAAAATAAPAAIVPAASASGASSLASSSVLLLGGFLVSIIF
ncbi:hypothetical protein SmJEL517_g04895 [Synchytrium microbalum]|uniref:NodB homology domain-containing protein n=1 Tax=Synchytrium microbalum TaxID=1806994 RepID=A0A507BWJ8_9FUNG|nr:uncharacterized protein SmJEL517_g04895 [Synchytrium microbalum]TPX31832.1 hypothetical protein SmJEL517_g04895 [Synchytrium microbalum]